jgi:hypothetical protein
VVDFERLDPNEHFKKNYEEISNISNKSDKASMIYGINKLIANETFSSCETNNEMIENNTALKMLIKNENKNDASFNNRILLSYFENNFAEIKSEVTKVSENFSQSILSKIADIQENNDKNIEVLGVDISSLFSIFSEHKIEISTKIDNLAAKHMRLQETLDKVLVNQNIIMAYIKRNEKITPENEKKFRSKKMK